MLVDIFFPEIGSLNISQVEFDSQALILHVEATTKNAICPECQTKNDRLHSYYYRQPADLPCVGQAVRLQIEVRRFFCDNKLCSKVTFAEQFPALLAPRARRTARLAKDQQRVAFVVSAESGARILGWLKMAVSPDTLLRLVRRAPEPMIDTPRVLGVDDWAMKKRCSYGTILVDLEAQQVIDLLPDRKAETLETWLKDHAGVEVISRDRGREYIKGASDGAPDAIQVADRWHLIKNLREALESLMMEKPDCLKAAGEKDKEEDISTTSNKTATMPESVEQAEPSPAEEVNRPITKAEVQKSARRARKQERYELVRALHQQGFSIHGIANHLGIARRTVRKYINAESCPFYPDGRRYRSKIDPFRQYLTERWRDGCHNGSQLWREIQEMGFDGSRATVSRWVTVERRKLPLQEKHPVRLKARKKPPRPKQTMPWTANRAAWLLMKPEAELDTKEKATLQQIFLADEQVVEAHKFAHAFQEIIRLHQPERLKPWLKNTIASGIEAFVTFGRGILQDLDAVTNAIKLHWSNGQTEGQVNRLKFIKRQMFGRADFDLLRKRVLGYHLAFGTVHV